MALFDDTILQAIPEPALTACNGRVTRFNAAAAQLFPELAEGAPLPDPLPPQGDGAGLLLAGGQNWHFSASTAGGGTLYLLHCARLDGMSRPQLDGTVRRLRQDAFVRSVQEETSFAPDAGEDDLSIAKVKSFYFKPMTREEAVLQMNLLGHNFFAFRDEDNGGSFAVVYRRNEGGYGLIDDAE